ncbi:alpha/beta hydrolase [Paraburkholderia susongensis]|uniref:Acetyl esterase n=1 Tax=Paraburkholderia susongensis TaxID=1515439 RepID=A0A1X7M1E4_9BURK|nr:alpha/beta hydrolase [Paraburkholderia susongensis]SMG59547.1 acetyl esterase [Paraburkholderia susongensis]
MNSTKSKAETFTPSPAPGQRDRGRPERLRAGTLDPEAEVLLTMLNFTKQKPVNRSNIRQHRLRWRLSALALGHADAVARVETLSIPGPHKPIRLKIYRPSVTAEAAPALLWFHGGGFVMGGLATADAICRHIAMASGVTVVAVRYRLAPEHDLYAGRADCMAAMDWIVLEGHSLGIDTTRLAVGGDSAGGNLAAAVAQRHTEQAGTALRLQVLVYPATNLRDDFASKAENASRYMLTSASIDAIRVLITQGRTDLADPWISPAFTHELHNLPPAVVVTAGFDPIRDDGLAYAGRLREAGVPVELLHYAGQFHGFLNFDGVLRAARDALERIGTTLRLNLVSPAGEAPAPADRTIELSARCQHDFAWAGLRMGRNLLIGSLMLGEQLESWYWTTTRRAMADAGWTTGLPAFPLFNPVAAYREWLGQHFAPIEASETYRGGVQP